LNQQIIMSIIVGKRNFIENFNNPLSTEFSKESFFRKKMVIHEHSSTRNIHIGLDQGTLHSNFNKLKHYFPQTDEKVKLFLRNVPSKLIKRNLLQY